jgi:PPOX class probable F420-dependent enzyme
MAVDFSKGVGPKILDQLQNEQVAWLTTTSADGTPQPRLIWFVWENDEVVFYSQPGAAKVSHIARNPRVALHFNSDPSGSSSRVLTGIAALDPDAPGIAGNQEYLAKYGNAIARLNETPEGLAAAFSLAYRFRPERIRGW